MKPPGSNSPAISAAANRLECLSGVLQDARTSRGDPDAPKWNPKRDVTVRRVARKRKHWDSVSDVLPECWQLWRISLCTGKRCKILVTEAKKMARAWFVFFAFFQPFRWQSDINQSLDRIDQKPCFEDRPHSFCLRVAVKWSCVFLERKLFIIQWYGSSCLERKVILQKCLWCTFLDTGISCFPLWSLPFSTVPLVEAVPHAGADRTVCADHRAHRNSTVQRLRLS